MAQLPKSKSERTKQPSPKEPQATHVKPEPAALEEMPDNLAFLWAVADPASASPAGILALQKMAGNRAVQRLLIQRQAPEEEEEIQTMSLAQRATQEEEEVQAKSLIQRAAPVEEGEVQAKSLIQREGLEE
jgi:hypothetical protein